MKGTESGENWGSWRKRQASAAEPMGHTLHTTGFAQGFRNNLSPRAWYIVASDASSLKSEERQWPGSSSQGPVKATLESSTGCSWDIDLLCLRAMPLTWLTVYVAEDTYSSEETVDHQPVHLRVMDTADLVTLSPSPAIPQRGQ